MRKASVLAIILAIALLLAACGSTGTPAATQAAAPDSGNSEPSAKAPDAEVSGAEKTGNFVLDYTPTKESGFVIGVITPVLTNAWLNQLVLDAEIAGDELKAEGIVDDLIVQCASDDPQSQITLMEGLINQGCDAIVVCATSENLLNTVVERAVDAGIVVIFIDRPDTMENVLNISCDNRMWGDLCYSFLCESIGGEGNTIEVTGVPGATVDSIRQRTMKEALARYPDVKVLASAPGYFTDSTAQEVASTFLAAYDDVDAVLDFECMAGGILQAFKAANRELPKAMIMDYSVGVLRNWYQNYPELNGLTLTFQSSISHFAVKVAAKILQGEKIDPEQLTTNPLNPELTNMLYIAPSYCVTLEALDPATDTWLQRYEGLENMTYIGLADAVELAKDREDSETFELLMTDEQVSGYFK